MRAESWTATKAVMSQEEMLKGSRKAVGEMIPVRFATTMAVPDSWKLNVRHRGLQYFSTHQEGSREVHDRFSLCIYFEGGQHHVKLLTQQSSHQPVPGSVL